MQVSSIEPVLRQL